MGEVREELIDLVMRETTDEITADGWETRGSPNVLVQGCRHIRGNASLGYDDPEDAARKFAGLIVDAILAALPSLSQGVEDGWVLVPREPTAAMLRAGQVAGDNRYWSWRGLGVRPAGTGLDGMTSIVSNAYRAMLAALPQQQGD